MFHATCIGIDFLVVVGRWCICCKVVSGSSVTQSTLNAIKGQIVNMAPTLHLTMHFRPMTIDHGFYLFALFMTYCLHSLQNRYNLQYFDKEQMQLVCLCRYISMRKSTKEKYFKNSIYCKLLNCK